MLNCKKLAVNKSIFEKSKRYSMKKNATKKPDTTTNSPTYEHLNIN